MNSTGISVLIVRFVNPHQPGWVECNFIDAWGDEHSFREKGPIVSANVLEANSDYPLPGVICCQIIKEWHDGEDRKIITIDTELPWHIESTSGKTCFDLLPEQIIDT